MNYCNFCKLKTIKADAKKEKRKVVTVPAKWGMGGIDVFAFPKHFKAADIKRMAEAGTLAYRVSWFQELPESCAC